MKIDRKEAKRIAGLAHLHFDDAALDRMAAEMTAILSYIDQLRDADISALHSAEAAEGTPMRDDVPRASLDRTAVAANAPAFSDDGHFIVPKVIGD